MNAALAVTAIGMIAVSGLVTTAFPRSARARDTLFLVLLVAGCALGALAAGLALAAIGTSSFTAPWTIPGGELEVAIDPISGVFLLQVFLIGALGALFGSAYWPEREQPETASKLRASYGVMVAGMGLLLVARNAVLFLVGWELMAIAAFLAVTTEDRKTASREAGLVYLIATRLGTLLIIAMFVVLRATTGSFSLAVSHLASSTPSGTAIFLLGLAGFGLKAGVMPLHVWLPGAHASAPSHVSALMSGVLIKMGIYGLVRVGCWFADVPLWWGVLVFALGSASAVLGVAFALGQHDLKRLLAYHSVENVGIIVMGLGVALIGRAVSQPALVVLGFAGALLHVFNHGLFKALLFFAGGATIHAVHTRELDLLGGLGRRLPWTAFAFLVGAVAICGLPPLNGFVSELFVYLAMAHAVLLPLGVTGILVALGVPVLALTGALAVACFVKVFGIVYLGEPRSAHGHDAAEPPYRMLVPMAVLACCCVVIGAWPHLVVPVLERALGAWLGAPAPASLASLVPFEPLSWVNMLVVTGCGLGALGVRPVLRRATRGPTWDCGYAAPTPRMQYTASSFASEIVTLFAPVLRPRTTVPALRSPCAEPSLYASRVPEVFLELLLLPLGRLAARGATWLRWIQHGNVHLYLLYILVTLVVMLFVWR